MGSGGFKQPPEGPKIGPVKQPDELPESKRQELGDLSKLVSEAAPLDPRIASAGQPTEKIEDLPSAAEPDNADDGVQRLEALQRILEEAPEPEPDPEELAIEEAAEPTVEDRQTFIRCILGNKPYRRTFDLFGGQLVVKMIDPGPGPRDKIFEQMTKDQQDEIVTTVTDWNLQLDRYTMMMSIEQLNLHAALATPHDAAWTSQDMRKTLQDFLNEFAGSTVYRSLLRVTRIFNSQLDRLVKSSLDSDFWEAGGPDSPSEPISEAQSTIESSPD